MKATNIAAVLVALAIAGCDTPTPHDEANDYGPGIVVPKPEPRPVPTPEVKEEVPVEDGPNCGEQSIVFDFATPQVMLVLDKSGSMASNTWDHDRDDATAEITRWASLHQVVQNVTTDFDARMEMGAVLFPAIDAPNESNALACSMGEAPDAGLSAMGGDAVLGSLPAADSASIFGGTPATAGVRMAAAHLLDVQSEQPQAIVLITDGAANCAEDSIGSGLFLQYDSALPVAAAEAFAAGIPVYVVGIDIEDELLELPVANPWERLSEVADYGGVPRDGDVPFYDVFDEVELDAALASIAEEVSCAVPVPEHFDSARVELTIDGAPILASDSCEAGEGWIADSPGQLRLCPDTCLAAQTGTTVEATMSCIPEG
ncbi:MAG: hypothetical protein ACRBN8_21015 [Nannocystales bacterium]